MALQIENINKSFGTDVILSDISVTASDNEKIGLIGPNGSGKSTLLKIIAGDISCDSGKILMPKDSKVGFLRQNIISDERVSIYDYMMSAFDDIVKLESEIRLMEEKMAGTLSEEEHRSMLKSYGQKSDLFEKRGGFEIKTRISTVLNGMGFGGFDKNMKVGNLSGGEKTKLSMAKLLLENPDVLLLDEPTNHLDFKTMQWLENYLKSYRGIIIAVSHDRYFLDFLADTIYEIEGTHAVRYTGNYSQYLITKKQNDEIQLKHYNAQREEIKRLEEYVAKNGVRASTAKSAKSRQKVIDKIVLEKKPVSMNKACRFKFESVFRSYNDVITAENVALGIPKNGILETIAKNISFDLKRGEKIAIVGANGAGKSTLLKTILGEHKYYEGSIEIGRNVKYSYYDQEQKQLCGSKTVFEEISDRFPMMDESDIRSKLGLVLFTEDDVFKNIRDLSGGERARLMFLIVMLEKANLLILDEPTNHLDLLSKEALDAAVGEYEGTVLFVSHDRYFLNKTADKIFELTADGMNKYNGNYDDYISALSLNVKGGMETSNEKSRFKQNSYEAEKRHNANIRSITKKAETAENRISQLEDDIKKINLELEKCGSDFEKANSLFADRQKCENELNECYELWEKLNNELENLSSE